MLMEANGSLDVFFATYSTIIILTIYRRGFQQIQKIKENNKTTIFMAFVDWHSRPFGFYFFFPECKHRSVWQQSTLWCVAPRRFSFMMSTNADGSKVFPFVSVACIHREAPALCGVWSLPCAPACFLLPPKSLISCLRLAATLLSLQHACVLWRRGLIFFSLNADGSWISSLAGLRDSLHLSLTSQRPSCGAASEA